MWQEGIVADGKRDLPVRSDELRALQTPIKRE